MSNLDAQPNILPIFFVLDASLDMSIDFATPVYQGIVEFISRLSSVTYADVSVAIGLYIAADDGIQVSYLSDIEGFTKNLNSYILEIGLRKMDAWSIISNDSNIVDRNSVFGMTGNEKNGLGATIRLLLAYLPAEPQYSKPLVVLILSDTPDDDWEPPATRLLTLSEQGAANVIVIGLGGKPDASVLKRPTNKPPFNLPVVTPLYSKQVFDWLFDIADAMMKGMASHSRGRISVPPPPDCLSQLDV